jgi:hypothetical protein
MIALICGGFFLSTSLCSNLAQLNDPRHPANNSCARADSFLSGGLLRMPLRLELSLFSVVLVAIGGTVRGGPAGEISWSSALFKTEAILRKDCGDKCVEVARQPVAASNCKCL